MKVYLTDKSSKFKELLAELKEVKVMPYSKESLNEKVTSIQINSKKELKELNLDFFFDYNLFPKNIISAFCEWSNENRKMKVGDTIVQQAYIPPLKSLSQKIVFGVRISEIINEKYRQGFSYETLEGHVEKGISTFTIEQNDDQLKFVIHTFSKPGNLLTKIVGPIFSVPYQTYCTKKCLKNVKE